MRRGRLLQPQTGAHPHRFESRCRCARFFICARRQAWLLYVLTALQLGISGFFFPARNAILPDIAEPHEMGAANALSSATWSVMLAMGGARWAGFWPLGNLSSLRDR